MRQYYAHLRLYRPQDQQYWTLGVHTQAESLGGLELQLKALEAGLRVAGAGKLYLQDVNIDAPGNGEFPRRLTIPTCCWNCSTSWASSGIGDIRPHRKPKLSAKRSTWRMKMDHRSVTRA